MILQGSDRITSLRKKNNNGMHRVTTGRLQSHEKSEFKHELEVDMLLTYRKYNSRWVWLEFYVISSPMYDSN